MDAGETDLPGTEDFNRFSFNTERILKKEEEGILPNVTESWRLKPSLRPHRKPGAPAWISHLAARSKLAQNVCGGTDTPKYRAVGVPH